MLRYTEHTGALEGGATPHTVQTFLSYVKFALLLATVFCAYFFSAYYAIILNPTGSLAVFIWPAAGIALTAAYFGGYRVAPAIFASAFLANLLLGAPVVAAFAIATGNTLEALIGAYLLQIAGFDPLFKRLRDSLIFIATSLASTLAAALVGATALVAAGELREQAFSITVLTWWIGDALGILILGTLLIRWLSRRFQFSERRISDFFEYIIFFTVLTVISLIIFWEPIPIVGSTPLLYLTFVPLTWGALRIGPRMVALALALVSVLAISGTILGHGPFAPLTPSHIVLLQTYLGTLAMMALLFVSTVEERKDSMRTARQRVEELREDVEEFSAADRAKNDFIAILSHELRNPLAPVLSSLELMQLNADKMPEFRGAIASMREQIGRITRLLDDLLDITRIARKKFTLRREVVKLEDILSHSLATASDAIKQRRHALRTMIPQEAMWIEADALRLEQVFVNLLNNAAKYTDPGGTITVSAVQSDSYVEVRVRDTGHGIPHNMLQLIFEPFRQAHGDIGGGAGLGIGLSLAKRFVELHNGVIEAKSDGLGKGSEFIVRLPLTDLKLLPPGGTIAPPATAVPQKKEKRLVLVVDDNAAAAQGIAKLLTHAGHDARAALNGAEALAMLAGFRPDIVFLDIGLPGESGYDLVRTIRQYLDPPPVLVALTGYGQEEDKERAREAGFDHHLTKPVTIADLEKILAIK